MSNKTHYRKVFKSDHLGTADLEDLIEAGSNLIFTVTHVKQEINVQVAGKKINANIAYFKEPIKPLVLNAINSKTMKQLCNGSPFIEDWQNVPIQLYIDPNAKLKGEVVGGVRILSQRVQPQLPALKEGTRAWDNAVVAFKRDGNLDAVLKRAIVSTGDMEKIKQEAAGNVSQH